MGTTPFKSAGDPLLHDEWNALVRLVWGQTPGFGDELTPFELKDDMTPGGSAEAWACKDEGGYVVRDTDAAKLTVWDDMMSNVRALGSDTTGGDGAFGFAQNLYGYLQIVVCKQQAKMCLCQLTAAQTGSDASFSVDNVTPVDGGQSPVTSSSATLTAYNKCAGAGADNAVACIAWNETSDHWEVQWIVNVSQAVVTSYQVDTTNMKLQKKTRTLWGNWVGSESDWTDVHTGDDCTA